MALDLGLWASTSPKCGSCVGKQAFRTYGLWRWTTRSTSSTRSLLRANPNLASGCRREFSHSQQNGSRQAAGGVRARRAAPSAPPNSFCTITCCSRCNDLGGRVAREVAGSLSDDPNRGGRARGSILRDKAGGSSCGSGLAVSCSAAVAQPRVHNHSHSSACSLPFPGDNPMDSVLGVPLI